MPTPTEASPESPRMERAQVYSASISPASSANTNLSANTASAASSDGHVISAEERRWYYKGVSRPPPPLLYRSNRTKVPFAASSDRFATYPVKTLLGVHGTHLNTVWRLVVSEVIDYLNSLGVKYSSIQPARFVTRDDSNGIIVLWISTHPGTTTEKTARNATPRMQRILEVHGVQDVDIEWFESPVVSLTRLSLPAPHIFPFLRRFTRFLAPLIGMPLGYTAKDGQQYDGTLGFFFREGQDRLGNPSSRILGITARHVLGKGRVDLESAQPVIVASATVFEENIQRMTDQMVQTQDELADEAAQFEVAKSNARRGTSEEVQRHAPMYDRWKLLREGAQAKVAALADLKKSISADWGDPQQRIVGHVDWAPDVVVDASTAYTLDLATFVLEPEKIKNFRGNVLDLGFKFTRYQLDKFFAHAPEAGTPSFSWPTDGCMTIRGYVPREELEAVPKEVDTHDQRCFIVLKNGAGTDITIGRLGGVEGYISYLDQPVESQEIVIYAYDEKEPFADGGDSGALVVDGRGRMVGVIHAGHPSGFITYATPAWWIVQQLQTHYSGADFTPES